MNKRLRTILQYAFFLLIGVALAWWSIKDLTAGEKSQIKDALKTARYWLIIPVFLMLLLCHYVRGLRWKLLIDSLGYKVRRRNTFFAVLIGYLTNQAVPRLGEVVKCTVLSRYEKVPVDKLIGTIILERIVDAITLLIVFGITLAIQPHLYSEMVDAVFYPPENPNANSVSGKIVFYIILGLAFLYLFGWMIYKKKTFKYLWQLLKKKGRSIWQGVGAIRHLKKRWTFVFYSLVIWTIYLLGGYIGFMALQQTEGYGIKEAFTVLSAGSVGMVATPGGIGAYPILVQQSMIMYKLESGIALAFGWLLWLAQTAVIVLGGLFSFVAMPYYNKQKHIEKS